MKFKTEKELVAILKETLNESYRKEYIQIFEEVSLGYGIADLVLSNFNEPKENQIPTKITLDKCDINILNLIKKSSKISFDLIMDVTRIHKKKILNSLEKLMANSYVKFVDNSFYIDKDYEFPFNVNFAIEAKLKDWKRALKQAYRYKWFAEYSYVVIDAHNSNSAINNIDTFEKYNVGLATITTDGELKRIYKPKSENPIDPKMQMLFSEKIKSNYELAR